MKMNSNKLNNKFGKIFNVLSFSLLFCIFFSYTPVVSAVEGIRYLYINVRIDKDGSANISQNITLSFNPQDYGGVISVLPLANQYDDVKNKFKISQIAITDKDHEPVKFKTKRSGEDILVKLPQNDKTDTSELTLSYKIKNAVKKQGYKTTFVFNPVRTNWPFPINQSIITIKLPDTLDEKDIATGCQVSKIGGKSDCLSKRYLFNPLNKIDGVVLIAEDIGKQDTFSVSASVPKNIIQTPLINSNILGWLLMNGIWIIIGLSVWTIFKSPKRDWHKKLWWWKYVKKRWLKFK